VPPALGLGDQGLPTARSQDLGQVERAINHLKQSRAVATRYDKRGYIFLGTATAASITASIAIWLRT